MRRALLPALVAALALALSGFGIGPGPATQGAAELRVTRNFGEEQLGQVARKDAIRSSDTVMRFLQSERKVTTRYGGGFVQSIDGIAGSKDGQHDWFYYVNGSEADRGAADYKLSPSDVVQWDYHDWSATQHVPAIVGAFPEPFIHGFAGKRFPTRLECTNDGSKACNDVRSALESQGVVVVDAPVGSEASDKSLRIVVAPWSDAKAIISVQPLSQGPSASGVYARFDNSGRLDLLDPKARVARVAPPGSGLVAATQPEGRALTWIVTGDNEAGVERAAQTLDPIMLRNAFAVAATPAGIARLPVQGG